MATTRLGDDAGRAARLRAARGGVAAARAAQTTGAASADPPVAVGSDTYGVAPPPPLALPRLALRLSTRGETAVKKDHPWVYDNSVASTKGEVLDAGTLEP
jgi:hypothetical protein